MRISFTLKFNKTTRDSFTQPFVTILNNYTLTRIKRFCYEQFLGMPVLPFDTQSAGLHSISECYKVLWPENRNSFPVLKQFSVIRNRTRLSRWSYTKWNVSCSISNYREHLQNWKTVTVLRPQGFITLGKWV